MAFDDVPACRQSQSRTTSAASVRSRLGAEERVVDLGHGLFVHTRSRVSHREHGVAARRHLAVAAAVGLVQQEIDVWFEKLEIATEADEEIVAEYDLKLEEIDA